jgi:hypothetical protein
MSDRIDKRIKELQEETRDFAPVSARALRIAQFVGTALERGVTVYLYRTPEGGVQIEFDSKEEGECLAMEVVIPPGEDDVASEFWAFPE